jgi:hypothetical protein
MQFILLTLLKMRHLWLLKMAILLSRCLLCAALFLDLTGAGLLNKGSCLTQALGVTKFISMRDVILATHCCAT